jgi:hypothetical protein
MRSVPDRLAQTFPSFGDRLVRNLHRAPHASRRTAECPLVRQHRPMYGNFWLWVSVLARMERIPYEPIYLSIEEKAATSLDTCNSALLFL